MTNKTIMDLFVGRYLYWYCEREQMVILRICTMFKKKEE